MDTNDANDEHDELTDADDVLDEFMDDEADYRERPQPSSIRSPSR